jgi:hypothetical protein
MPNLNPLARPWRCHLSLLSALCLPAAAGATPLLSPDLASFSVLGASAVTNAAPSDIGGNVGVWQIGGVNAITGFNSSPGMAVSDPQVGGLVHAGTTTGTPNAMRAQNELTTARNNLSSLGAGTVLAEADLGGLTLLPGVYTVHAGSTNLSGRLRLDGGGNANAAWVFQMDSTLITSADAGVDVFNTGAGAGVYWNVASSATLGTRTAMLGNVLALASVSMDTRATDLCGRVLADSGAVTLLRNSVTSLCSGVLAGSDGLNGGLDVAGGQVTFLPFVPTAGLPEPATWALVGLALGALAFSRRGAAVSRGVSGRSRPPSRALPPARCPGSRPPPRRRCAPARTAGSRRRWR